MEIYAAQTVALHAAGVATAGDDSDHECRRWDSGSAADNGRQPFVDAVTALHLQAFDVVWQAGVDGGEAAEAALKQHADSIGVRVDKHVVQVPGAGSMELLTIQKAGSKVLLRTRHYQCACAPHALRWLIARAYDIGVAILATWQGKADATRVATLPLVEAYVRVAHPPQSQKEYLPWAEARWWEVEQGRSEAWDDLELAVQTKLRAMGINDIGGLYTWKARRGKLTAAAEKRWGATGPSFYVPLLSSSGTAGGTYRRNGCV